MSLKPKYLILAFLFACAIFPLGFSAYISAPNGSFETGDLTDWNFSANTFNKTPTISIGLAKDLNLFSTDGSFYFKASYPAATQFFPSKYANLCTKSKILSKGKYDINFAFGCYKININDSCYINNVYAFATNSVDSNATSNPNVLIVNFNPVSQPRNKDMFYSSGTLNNTNSGDSYFCLGFKNSSTNTSIDEVKFAIDDVKIQAYSSLINTITTTAQPVGVLEAFSVNVLVLDSEGNNVTDANVVLKFNSDANVVLNYNSSLGKYEYSNTGVGRGTYSYTVYTSKIGNYLGDVDSGTFVVDVNPLSLDVVCVSNCTPRITATAINLDNTNNLDDVVFSVTNNTSFSISAPFVWVNPIGGKQYFIYTSTDDVNWVFSDTLTFGSSSSYNDAIQKIPILNTNKYSFQSVIANGVKTYYKLEFVDVPLYWEAINNSSDWSKYSVPSSYIDENSHEWDLFNDSNFSPLKVLTTKNYQQLTSADISVGFVLQFTAFASASDSISVGYDVDGNFTGSSISVTTTPTRYSVLVNPNNYFARIGVKSSGSATGTRVYMSEYALIPKSYFLDRLEIFETTDDPIKAILFNGTSALYIQEGKFYKFKTSAWDRVGDLSLLRFDVLIGATTIKSHEYSLTDASKVGATFVWEKDLGEIIDINSSATRNIIMKATLINTSGQSVAEQYQALKLLQYPSFPADFTITGSVFGAKVGTNPQVSITINQKQPDKLLGIKVFIWKQGGSMLAPSYSETILNDKLGCTQNYCSKNLTIDGYAYDSNATYTILVGAILSSEAWVTNPDGLDVANPLTRTRLIARAGYFNLQTARIFQVFERSDRKYKPTEKVPLVIQARDVALDNLENEFSAYITTDIYGGATGTYVFYPKTFVYDETTGYNYWFFNDLLFQNSGSLFATGTDVNIVGHLISKSGRYNGEMKPVLTKKCLTGAGINFNKGTFLMNLASLLFDQTNRDLFGCTSLPPESALTGSSSETSIVFDSTRDVNSDITQIVICLKTDSNSTYQDNLKQDLLCAILYRQNEGVPDRMVIRLGNNNSDYALTDSTKQYLEFTVPAEQIVFNDLAMLRSALATEYQTDTLDTYGEVVAKIFDKISNPYTQAIADTIDWTTQTGFIPNVGSDINMQNFFDPNYISGILTFKINGIKVINQYDYLTQDSALELLPPSKFLAYAKNKQIYVPASTTTVEYYTSDMRGYTKLKLNSPLVIYQAPQAGVTRTTSTGQGGSVVPAKLSFTLISDFIYNSEQNTSRAIVPFFITTFGLFGQGKGICFAGFCSSEITQMLFDNWAWIFLAIIFLVIVSLIYRNFKSGGGLSIRGASYGKG